MTGRGRAFTLAELLLTIGIMALLVTILNPMLRGTIAGRDPIACVSDERKMSLATQVYLNDHDMFTTVVYAFRARQQR
jgi:prepilin-type N-terminal cleavage/methylation domain-containing protein